MFVPTVLFGMSFPVLTHLVTKGSQDIGSSLGIVYGMNTFGGIVGSIVAGYLLLPNLGSQQTLVCLSMLNFLSGMLLFATSSLFTGFIKAMSPSFKPNQESKRFSRGTSREELMATK